MRKDIVEYTQSLDGFQVVRCEFCETEGIEEDGLSALSRLTVRDGRKRTLNVWIERRGACVCPQCGSRDVSAYAGRERAVRGLMEGECPTVIHFAPRLVYCHACRARRNEDLPFLPHPKARLTKALENTVVALRGEMTVSAIADYYDLDWETVKNAEKRRLAADYAHVPLDRVTAITIDEIQAFPGARGIESHLEGILGYWRHDGASNASAEGFDNKIRRLIEQAYGLRDREYFRLKVFALPKQKPRRGL